MFASFYGPYILTEYFEDTVSIIKLNACNKLNIIIKKYDIFN